MDRKLNIPNASLIEQFKAIVGAQYALTDKSDQQRYLHEWRDRYVGKTPLVLRPNKTEQVASIVALANENAIGLVPQGGNTGLVGGQIPFETGTEIVLSLERMNAIRVVDPLSNSMTVDAGVTLTSIQAAAQNADRLFPLSIGSEGTCQIGGNLATNAGGIHVLRYGNMRDLTLGLEVVFADGQIWHGLKSLRKDNTGYDIKNLLVGSEGTLGVITAATIKLFPKNAETSTIFVGLKQLEHIGTLFSLITNKAGPFLTAFEFMPRLAIDILAKHYPWVHDPLEQRHPWYVLLKLASPLADGSLEQIAMDCLEKSLEQNIISDAIISASQAQADRLWHMREALSEVQKFEGGSIKHDVSLPLSAITSFIKEADATIERLIPGARPLSFGHFGDGNVHYNISQPLGMDKAEFLSMWENVSSAVHCIVLNKKGSISAEHGIGRMKVMMLQKAKPALDIEMMQLIKAAFDPKGILNPGKVLPA